MGNRKQPIDLVIAKGKKNLTKKEIEERRAQEIRAPSDNIQPPSYLPDKLKNEFMKVAKELDKIGIMTNLDCTALARYIVSEHNFQKASKKLIKMGVGNKAYHDTVLLQEKLFKMARQSAGDLGLTISSRCKLVVPKKIEVKEESKFDRMFGNV